MKKHSKCKARKCNETAQIRGLCKKHFGERRQADDLRQDALRLLDKSRIDETYAVTEWIKADLQKLQIWWGRVCSSLDLQKEDQYLKDEAPYAMEWCITLAMEMVKTERAARAGNPCDQGKVEIIRSRVWRRFENLETGVETMPPSPL